MKFWSRLETHFDDETNRERYVQRMSYDLSKNVYDKIKENYLSKNLDDNDRASWSVRFVNHMIDNHVWAMLLKPNCYAFVLNERFIADNIDEEIKILAMTLLNHSYRQNIQTYLTMKWGTNGSEL